MKKSEIVYYALVFIFVISCKSANKTHRESESIKVNKIWDAAEHNAFTDLIKFNGSYYCSFREGSGHIPGTDGAVRILKSSDSENWESVALLKKDEIDLRDPKLSVTPEGKIMVIIGGSIYKDGILLGRKPQVSFSDKSGTQFSSPEEVVIDPEIVSWGDWIWRVVWHKGVGYGINYQIGPQERRGPTAIYLVKTTDGTNFEKVSKLEVDGFPNEATIQFDEKGDMYVLIRRELDDFMAVWGKSVEPYEEWDFKKLNFRLGGPNFIFLNNELIILGTRVYEPSVYTGLYLGTKEGDFKEIIQLPSDKDNSYPGFVLEKDRLLVSYYSAHEGKAAIYIAEIPIKLIHEPY